MEYRLLSVSKSKRTIGINIGDYVQALAASQYYPRVDGFLDRDEDLKDYDGEPCKMIMNGWYMHNSENWPPSEKIIPLFVAFHLNVYAKDALLSPASIGYLKKHQPIGCRDMGTLDLLKGKGVDAYFSGCMTLTLGKTYRTDERCDRTYIVDPVYNGPLGLANVLRAIWTLLAHPCDTTRLYKTKQLCLHHGRNVIKKLLKTALYYKEYTKMFGRKLIMESTYITQEDYFYRSDFKTEEERLKEAERLVKLYAKAKCVITSRIHCALPCLGLGTPVVYIEKGQDVDESSCRMAGLRDLFNVIKMSNGQLILDFTASTPLTSELIPSNKETWQEYAYKLDKTCSDFMAKTI